MIGEHRRIARRGMAALAAMSLVATPAYGDEVEAEEVVVGEEVVSPPRTTPCPECAINNGSVSIAISNDFTNAYFFRGILQEKNGFIWQPSAEVSWALWEAAEGDTSAIQALTLTAGTWNSVHTAQTFAVDDGTGPGNWYESNVYAGLGLQSEMGLSAGVTYVAYLSPNNAFGSVQEIDLDVSFDDSGLYGTEMENWGFSTNPYLLWGFEVDKTRFGQEKGIYMEAGAAPTVIVAQNSDYPVAISMPLAVGLSLDDYYLPATTPPGVPLEDNTFGYATVGLGVSVPLSFIPARLGSFSAGVSGQWLALGSNLQRYNNGPRHDEGTKTNPEEGRFGEWIGVASINWQY